MAPVGSFSCRQNRRKKTEGAGRWGSHSPSPQECQWDPGVLGVPGDVKKELKVKEGMRKDQ